MRADPIQCPQCRCEFVLPEGVTYFQAMRSAEVVEAHHKKEERRRVLVDVMFALTPFSAIPLTDSEVLSRARELVANMMRKP